MKVKNAVACKTMEEAIDRAEKQVKDWYNPNNPDTPRVFIKNECNYNLPQYSNDEGVLQVLVFSGGDPKGTVIVNHKAGTVMALSMYCDKIRIYRPARSCMPYDEQIFDATRRD